ncbi:MAG: ABC transporter ATP-binding protein [Deltaproteobacteria bacterium]|nr:ABC transporter ATP-binding protein [Deltaproteobacteria bacterium]
MPKIQIANLTKSFSRQDGSTLRVLDGVTFHAEENEFCCLLGVSGCGKSTVLNILAGLVPPDAGEIRLDGQGLDTHRTRVGYVFQRPRLLNWRTIRQNMEFALKAHGVPHGEWGARVDHYIQLVGLQQFDREFPLALSGGMQQRVAIARALVIDPDVLLMDEPFSNLDELTARGLRRELLRIWREERKTVLFVTHNALEAVYLADRIVLFTNRPARVMRELVVDVPRERELEDPRLIKLQKEIVAALGLQ